MDGRFFRSLVHPPIRECVRPFVATARRTVFVLSYSFVGTHNWPYVTKAMGDEKLNI
jgi:hypothetical protein